MMRRFILNTFRPAALSPARQGHALLAPRLSSLRLFCTPASTSTDITLSDIVKKRLEKKGITELYPVQKATLPLIQQGVDILAQSQTGSGKTLAFGIPMVEKLLKDEVASRRNPRGVVLAPTRELAKQVADEIRSIAFGRDDAPTLSVCPIYGGTSYDRQFSDLERGVDILVATPGRLVDHLERGSVSLEDVQQFVIDECDEMLRIGFRQELENIISNLPKSRQNVMFSATVPHTVKSISKQLMGGEFKHVDLVDGKALKAADSIEQLAIPCYPSRRLDTLRSIVEVYGKDKKVLVFVEQKTQADELAMNRDLGFECRVLHGDIAQGSREEALRRFRRGDVNVLVATDVAARGIDIPNVDLVIQYTVPRHADAFVHRTGRTGRAGRDGQAIVLFDTDDSNRLRVLKHELDLELSYRPPPHATPETILELVPTTDLIATKPAERGDVLALIPSARAAFNAWCEQREPKVDVDVCNETLGSDFSNFLATLMLNSHRVVSAAKAIVSHSILTGKKDFVCIEFAPAGAKSMPATTVEKMIIDATRFDNYKVKQGVKKGHLYCDIHTSSVKTVLDTFKDNEYVAASLASEIPRLARLGMKDRRGPPSRGGRAERYEREDRYRSSSSQRRPGRPSFDEERGGRGRGRGSGRNDSRRSGGDGYERRPRQSRSRY